MRPARAISLVAILATIFTGSLTCSPASATIPDCHGDMRATIDASESGILPTPESAAAQALEITFSIDVRNVVLLYSEEDRYRATGIDGAVLEHPPTVVIGHTEHGFTPAGVTC